MDKMQVNMYNNKHQPLSTPPLRLVLYFGQLKALLCGRNLIIRRLRSQSTVVSRALVFVYHLVDKPTFHVNDGAGLGLRSMPTLAHQHFVHGEAITLVGILHSLYSARGFIFYTREPFQILRFLS